MRPSGLGNFKLVRKFGCDWELYDMDVDRTELIDLTGRNTPLETDLLKQYNHWAETVGVMDWNVALPRLMKVWNLDSVEG